MQFKKCSTCGEKKSLSDFYKDKRTKDGLYSNCKSCAYQSSKNWESKNLDKVRLYANEYRKKHTELWYRCFKRYYRNNPVKNRARSLARSIELANAECLLCKSKEHLHRHHFDYNSPLDVIILCRDCHYKIHRNVEYRKSE